MPKRHSTNRRLNGPLLDRGRRFMLLFSASMLGTGLLTGCGGEARLVSPTTEVTLPLETPAASPAPATPVPGPSLERVVWATSVDATTQAPTDTVRSFGVNALTIYACVSINRLGKGTNLEASWTYNGTSLDAFATQLTLLDSVPQRWIAFHISRDPNVSWPPGTYKISIAVNGNVLQSASVEVTAAD